MSFYAVDSKRQSMRSTGIVNEVKEWEEKDGRRRPSEIQARDEDTGMPKWQVEVVYKQTSYGRESMATGVVEVGGVDRPVTGEFAKVEFVGLAVEVRVNKAGGLVEMWHAERLAEADKAPSSSSSSSSSGSKAAA